MTVQTEKSVVDPKDVDALEALEPLVEPFQPGSFGRWLVLAVVKKLGEDKLEKLGFRPALTPAETAELESLERRHHTPVSFAEELAWEREFGADRSANWRGNIRFWVGFWKDHARRYGLTYTEAKAAYIQVWTERGQA
ncbi:MAG: hypothetical protein ACYDAL_14090 [Candidatus Dormibacteraceae bacterium]